MVAAASPVGRRDDGARPCPAPAMVPGRRAVTPMSRSSQRDARPSALVEAVPNLVAGKHRAAVGHLVAMWSSPKQLKQSPPKFAGTGLHSHGGEREGLRLRGPLSS